MKKSLFVLLACLSIGTLAAQPTTYVLSQPDCLIFFTFTAAGQTSPTSPNFGLDNRTTGCDVWNMTASVSGFGAISLALQSAPNVAGAPGAYTNGMQVQQTVLSGSNPITSTTGGFVWMIGYGPWVQATLASATGSGVVNGAVYGWRIPSAAGAVGAPTSVTIIGPFGQATMAGSIPVVIASNQSAVPVDEVCNNPSLVVQSLFNLSGSGDTQIAAGTTGKQIKICHISFATGSTENIYLDSGTGSNCASGPTAVTGVYQGISAMVLGPWASLVVPTGTNLCINQNMAQALGGVVTYVIQ
jgi:hypothetical protein